MLLTRKKTCCRANMYIQFRLKKVLTVYLSPHYLEKWTVEELNATLWTGTGTGGCQDKRLLLFLILNHSEFKWWGESKELLCFEPTNSRSLMEYPKPALQGTLCNIIILDIILLTVCLWNGHCRLLIGVGERIVEEEFCFPAMGKLSLLWGSVFSWVKVVYPWEGIFSPFQVWCYNAVSWRGFCISLREKTKPTAEERSSNQEAQRNCHLLSEL